VFAILFYSPVETSVCPACGIGSELAPRNLNTVLYPMFTCLNAGGLPASWLWLRERSARGMRVQVQNFGRRCLHRTALAVELGA
jgi:hypothetical protein